MIAIPTYFFIAAVGYALMAAVAILDKFILSKSLRVSTYAFYSTVFFFGAFLLLPFSEPITLNAFWWALASGLGFGFATWTMFLGLRYGEATHVVPFIGAVTAVFVYGLSIMVLGDAMAGGQTAGIVLLVLASLLFSYEKVRKHAGRVHPSFLWALLSGFLFALSHVAAKHFYGEYSFVTGLVWTKGLVGIVAFFALFLAYHDIFGKKKRVKDTKNSFWIVVANKSLAILGTLAIQYAISVGSVAVVTGLVGLQYALILIFAAVSTLFAPRFFSEYFTKKEVLAEVGAILLVIGGVIFLL